MLPNPVSVRDISQVIVDKVAAQIGIIPCTRRRRTWRFGISISCRDFLTSITHTREGIALDGMDRPITL